jgi:uncharacterized protein YjbI with pentapeptide repeats
MAKNPRLRATKQRPAGQSSTAPQPVPRQRWRRVIVTVVAVLLIVAVSWILWRNGFPWYIVAALAILALILIGLIFLGYTPRWSKYTGFRGKTLWDWVQLLIIPFVIGAGAIWFNIQQSQISLQASVDQQQATILQTYIDNIQELLLNHNLLNSNTTDDVAILARARTLTALHGLDPDRKGRLLIFLNEAQLLNTSKAIIVLNGADLTNAALGDSDLRGVNLQGADLYGAALYRANLSSSNLQGADLRYANLQGTNLSSSSLQGADLTGADLSCAKPDGGQIVCVNLQGANLSGAQGLTQPQLDQVSSCPNAAMLPSGLKCNHNQ